MRKHPISRHSDEFEAHVRAFRPDDYERLLIKRPVRPLRSEERDLISVLAAAYELDDSLVSREALDAVRVRDMLDAGMGSIRFLASVSETDRSFGQAAGEVWYIDSDGVPVSFCIFLDNYGQLYELDIWKEDFSSLKNFPRVEDLQIQTTVTRP